MTVALVLDGSGFPKRSAVFAGTAREAKTLAQRVGGLSDHPASHPPTGVLDAGFAIEENSTWLGDHPDRYRVVSRERHRAFNAEEAVTVKVLERLGRVKQKYARAAQYDDVSVEHDEAREPATALQWARNQTLDDTLGGGLLAHPSRRLG